jgi:hypothetical protein
MAVCEKAASRRFATEVIPIYEPSPQTVLGLRLSVMVPPLLFTQVAVE